MKHSEAVLSISGDFWENFICPPHSLQDWWESSQPARCIYTLQPDLLGGFPADVCPDITGQFGCGHKGEIQPFSGGDGGGRGFWSIAHSRYCRQQIASDTMHFLFPSNTFLPRTYHFFPSKSLSQQKFACRTHAIWLWGSDPLGASVGYKLKIEQSTLVWRY